MKKNNKTKTDVLKRRFHYRKKNDYNPVTVESPSEFALLTPVPYVDSDVWAFFEASFADHARQFYLTSGADRYNHDALDLEIDKHYGDEVQHYKSQRIHHLNLLKNHIKPGIEGELANVNNEIDRVNARLETLRNLLEEKQKLHDTYNRKAG